MLTDRATYEIRKDNWFWRLMKRLGCPEIVNKLFPKAEVISHVELVAYKHHLKRKREMAASFCKLSKLLLEKNIRGEMDCWGLLRRMEDLSNSIYLELKAMFPYREKEL